MPILYVHGVAVRRREDDGWEAIWPFLAGLDWSSVRGHLRQHLAPALNPARPDDVSIETVFWGDLGARPLPHPVNSSDEDASDPAKLSAQALADKLEERVRASVPLSDWPQAIEVSHAVAQRPDLREGWEHKTSAERWELLFGLVEDELTRRYPLRVWPKLKLLRQRLRSRFLERVTHLRGPLEDFLPYFLGDVMKYPLERGTPAAPGPIPSRILEGLLRLQAQQKESGEKVVVVSHSLGGQLLYDVLSSFAPAHPELAELRIDFWAAAGSQLELFSALNLFERPCSGGLLPPVDNVACLWNIWSPTDLLSFQVGHALPNVHDVSMPLTDDFTRAHMAYITTPLFYEIVASKVRAATPTP